VCSHEASVWESVATGQWPDTTDQALKDHVRDCASCADLVAVTSALLADAACARTQSAPPSSAIVWWRAQMRARQEAARAAERPLTVVHALAIACATGLLVGLIGLAGAWVRDSSAWPISSPSATLGVLKSTHLPLTGAWSMLPWIALAATLVLAPLAVYVIVSED